MPQITSGVRTPGPFCLRARPPDASPVRPYEDRYAIAVLPRLAAGGGVPLTPPASRRRCERASLRRPQAQDWHPTEPAQVQR